MTTHTLPPEVKVRELEWEHVADQIPKHAFAAYTAFSRWLIVCEFLSMNRMVYRFNGTDYGTLDAAKAAAQADYTARIISALEPSGEGVGAEAGQCERCQGNGEIVTDWDSYLEPRPGDTGDEAVAECPDCGGTGDAQPLSGMEGVLREALRKIGGGHDPRLSDLALAGEWHECVSVLQGIARAALSTPVSAASPEGEARAAVKPLTTSEIEKIILTTEVPELSDRGDRIWTRRMAVALCNRQFSIPAPEGFVLVPVEPTEAMIKGLAYELCSQRGLHPNKVDQGGVELWETFKPTAKLTLAEVVRLVTVARQGTAQTQENNRG